ncbi:unnamed protein product [Trifolium pratense]|uniref:Uncharacterized protein n=1 Tax=Trifolium pratense TaxID=57577 RepID=A0ACB0IGV0_TRIPR|nr:unnamed protein product [Trifolium pratense]
MSSSSMFNFRVHRCQPELVQPAAPTPHEIKLLSDIDNQECLRFYFPMIFMYHHEPSMTKKDPVKVLRHALSQTLVYYYPFAGRIREGAGGKLMVDCNGEGVMFIEAEADTTLDQFGDSLHPPFPWFQQLLDDDVHGTQQIIDHPILLMQVTRLKCGGFIVSLNINHTISDATGLKQFMNAWAEMARGAHQPSIQPIWHRELLMARNPPHVTCNHREFEQIILPPNTVKKEDATTIVHQSFVFTPAHVAAIRCLVPIHLRQCTAFDLITACFWCCRTKALQLEPNEEVRMIYTVNARSRLNANQSSLVGYYGNCSAFPVAVTSAGNLICGNPLGYAVELIKNAKAQVTEEYMHSLADLSVIKERCIYNTIRSCVVSDMTRAKYENVNFGWGAAVYGGVVKGGAGPLPGATFIVPHKNAKEGLILLITCLPYEDMKRFAEELDKMFGNQNQPTTSGPSFVMSSL